MSSLDDMAIYFFVRGDLREEDQMVQFGHAMLEMVSSYGPAFAKYRVVGLDGGSSEKAFAKTQRKLSERKIPHAEYSDPDHQDWGVTAIVTIPLTPSQASPLANYRLRRYSPPAGASPAVGSKPSGEPGSLSSEKEHQPTKLEVGGSIPSVSSKNIAKEREAFLKKARCEYLLVLPDGTQVVAQFEVFDDFNKSCTKCSDVMLNDGEILRLHAQECHGGRVPN